MDCEKCKNFNPEYAPKLMGIGPVFLCRNYERKPPFSPGDLVMRKDGKEITIGVYSGYILVIHEDNVAHVITMPWMAFDAIHISDLTLAPAKPTLDDYDVEGFRPAEYDDFYWACNDPYPMVIRSICKMSYPAWILRRKKKAMKVEFEGEFLSEGNDFGKSQTGQYLMTVRGNNDFPLATPCKITVEWQEE